MGNGFDISFDGLSLALAFENQGLKGFAKIVRFGEDLTEVVKAGGVAEFDDDFRDGNGFPTALRNGSGEAE